jgi:hypothetical protein
MRFEMAITSHPGKSIKSPETGRYRAGHSYLNRYKEIHMKRLLAIPLLLLIAFALPALAQSSGQSVRVNMGVVDKADSVTLQNTGESGAAGTVAGAAIGYNLGSGKSSSKRRRHAIIGGAVGGAIGSSGTYKGWRVRQRRGSQGNDQYPRTGSDRLQSRGQ